MSEIRLQLRASAGFSMVEIMVGVLIGMVSAVVMMQVLALAEGQKRAATGGSDAQTGGAIALQTVQRDIREAGYELGTGSLGTSPIGCNLILPLPGGSEITLTGVAPVTINHPNFTAANPKGDNSPDPNTDSVMVIYGSGNYAPDGDAIRGASEPNYTVRSMMAFTKDDRVIASWTHKPGEPCTLDLRLDRVTATPSGSPAVPVAKWVAGASVLYNLGPAPVIRVYAVRAGKLTVCNYVVNDCGNPDKKKDASVWVPIAENIVSMRAQYGRDTLTPAPTPGGPTNYRVDLFDQTTPGHACGWLRVPAVRIALVARVGQFERNIVTTTSKNSTTPNAPTWAGKDTHPLIGKPSPQGDPPPLGPDTADDEPWKHYRYKVFETVVPIRTMTYVKPSC